MAQTPSAVLLISSSKSIEHPPGSGQGYPESKALARGMPGPRDWNPSINQAISLMTSKRSGGTNVLGGEGAPHRRVSPPSSDSSIKSMTQTVDKAGRLR